MTYNWYLNQKYLSKICPINGEEIWWNPKCDYVVSLAGWRLAGYNFPNYKCGPRCPPRPVRVRPGWSADVLSKMFGVKLLLILPALCGCLGLVTHQLYDLTPAPYLNKHYSQYQSPDYLSYRDKPINVYRDTNDITDQAELTDAIRTQDKDHLVSDSNPHFLLSSVN